ncbi:MAG: hypothetical protein HY685_01920 [Chloroflexi bacterium]|nr:hypothetical protein [Chloroflexota bacterium]
MPPSGGRPGRPWLGSLDFWLSPPRLTLAHLFEAQSLDPSLAALLWLFLERRASLIVAAPPRLAGKTTTLVALLDLLPAQVDVYPVWGQGETFAFLDGADPARAYLLVDEISPHFSHYLWGPALLRLFQALKDGYPFAGTMHAGSPEEALGELEYGGAFGGDRTALPDLIVILRSDPRQNRGVESVTYLEGLDAAGHVVFRPLARWDAESQGFRQEWETATEKALERRLGLEEEVLRKEMERRAAYLSGICRAPGRGAPPVDVRDGILRYYASLSNRRGEKA